MTDYETPEENASKDTQQDGSNAGTPLKPDEVIDSASKILKGDKDTVRTVMFALAVYGVAIAMSCIGKYFATKWAMKAAIRESRRH